MCLGLIRNLMSIALFFWAFVSPIRAYEYIHGDPTNSSIPKRLVSVGDLHGDYDDTTRILTSLGIMGSEGEWIGGSTTLVQTGDVSDRGPKSREIYDLLHRLQDEAPKHGGQVILLLGNHELMNLQGDFDYSTNDENQDYGGLEARRQSLSPTGALGQALRKRHQTLALVETTPGSGDGVLFVHGGLLPEMVEHYGQRNEDAVNKFNEVAASLLQGDSASLIQSSNPVFGDEGPFWLRRFAMSKNTHRVCRDLERTLQVFGARRMVVGHTIQESGHIGSRCGGRLLLGDTQISRFVGDQSHLSAIVWKDLGTAEAFATYPSSKIGSFAETDRSHPPIFPLPTPPRKYQLMPHLRSSRHEVTHKSEQ